MIIAQRPCALLKSVKHSDPLSIDMNKCKMCRMCMRLGCPAIVDRGDHLEINTALCVGCDLCSKVCRFDAIEKAGVSNE